MCRVLPIDQSEITLFDPAAMKARRERLWKSAQRAVNEDGPVVKLVSADFRATSEIGFIPKPVLHVVKEETKRATALRAPSIRTARPSVKLAIELYAEAVAYRYGAPKLALEIMRDIASIHGISREELCGKCRDRHLARARQHAFYAIASERPHMSFPDIARLFGNRDHTTIVHGVHSFATRYGLPHIVRAKGVQPARLKQVV
jgi:hypothetical protein